MAEIVSFYRLLLDGSVPTDKVIQEIGEKLKEISGRVEDHKEEPIGFGINALKLMIVTPEEDGITDKIANILESLQGVSNVELEMVSRRG